MDDVQRHAELIAAKPIVLHMRPRAPWWSRFCHNVLAHPLLILFPPLGQWLHERTEP